MSIDTYSYPIPQQGMDQKSQRTSIQNGGFASMMDVLTQNEAMNQTDNDAFVVPFQEEVIQPSENPIQVQKTLEEDVSQDIVKGAEEPIENHAVILEESEDVEALIAPALVPTNVLSTPVPTLASISVEDQITSAVLVPQETQVPVADIEESQPLPQYTPVPKAETPIKIEVPFIEDVPEVITQILPKVVVSPLNEGIVKSNPEQVPVQAAEAIPALPNFVPTVKNVKRKTPSQDFSKNLEDSKQAPRQLEVFATDTSLSKEVEIEEDPKVRFVRYVEKEIVTPKFSKGQDESLHIPEEMQIQKEPLNPSGVQSGGVLGTEKSTRSVSGVMRSEGTQASSLLEKNSTKEELKMPKRKLEQSFAKLLKEAKELAEDFEPEFHTKILQKLEIQVKDPAGIIQLEIAQKEAMVHVRAVVPSEAMSDLHYLGQDVQESLQDLGLQLGSYELRSQDEEEDHTGFGGMDDIGFDDIETEDVETINSDYIVDKRV